MENNQIPTEDTQTAAAETQSPPFSCAPMRTAVISSDCAVGDDFLGISEDARGIAGLIAAQNLSAPLSIAVFGNWGAGKTFFMNEIKKQVGDIQQNIRVIQSKSDKDTREQKYLDAFCRNIMHIEFNAWYYVDTNLYASLANHIFEQFDSSLKGQDSHDASVKRVMLDALEEERERQAAVLAEKKKEAEQLGAHMHRGQKELLDETVRETEEYKALQQQKGLFKTVEPHFNTARNADEVVRKANSRSCRTRMFFKQIPKKDLLLGASVLGSTLIFLLLTFFEKKYKLGTSIGAGLGAILTFILAWLKKSSIADIRNQISEFIGIIKKLVEMQKTLEKKKEKISALELEVQEREKAIEALNNKIEKIQKGEYIEHLAGERSSGETYKKHLGLANVLRQDFQLLSDYISRKQAGERVIDRIVLYIDDLDRCPAGEVVEVLKAIYLLLSFNIFVVIVAVDVQWITKCLAEHYKALFRENEGALSAAAYDYLEKVFQLAIKLQPISKEQSESYIKSLFEKDLMKGQYTKSAVDLAAAAKEDIGTSAQYIADIENLAAAEEDVRDVIKFAEVLGTSPRTIKRAINIYKLIKTHKNNYDNILVLLLLSIMIKLPKMAADVFRQIALAGEGATIADILRMVNKKEQQFEAFDAFLKQNKEIAAIRASMLKPLVPVVSRYSFYLDELQL